MSKWTIAERFDIRHHPDVKYYLSDDRLRDELFKKYRGEACDDPHLDLDKIRDARSRADEECSWLFDTWGELRTFLIEHYPLAVIEPGWMSTWDDIQCFPPGDRVNEGNIRYGWIDADDGDASLTLGRYWKYDLGAISRPDDIPVGELSPWDE